MLKSFIYSYNHSEVFVWEQFWNFLGSGLCVVHCTYTEGGILPLSFHNCSATCRWRTFWSFLHIQWNEEFYFFVVLFQSFLLFFLMVLRFKRRVLRLLNRCSTTWGTLPATFCFSYFSGGVSQFCPRPAILHLMASYLSGITGLHHHTSLLIKMRFLSLLPGLALNCDPPSLHIPSSWDNRMHHYARPYVRVVFYEIHYFRTMTLMLI
jgi:hypothetical protein